MIEFILAIIAAVAFTTSGIFQIIRMHKTQSSQDVSLLFIILMLIGVFATTGLTYLGDNAIGFVIERTVNSLLTATIVIVVIYYRQKYKKINK